MWQISYWDSYTLLNYKNFVVYVHVSWITSILQNRPAESHWFARLWFIYFSLSSFRGSHTSQKILGCCIMGMFHIHAGAIKVENFPLHLKNELQKLQNNEDMERQLQEIERNTCKVETFAVYIHRQMHVTLMSSVALLVWHHVRPVRNHRGFPSWVFLGRSLGDVALSMLSIEKLKIAAWMKAESVCLYIFLINPI